MPPGKPSTADHDDLVARQEELEQDLRQVMGGAKNSDNPTSTPPPPLTAPVPPKRKPGQAVSLVELPPVPDKTDTHWDFLLKEMQWLATDFTSERKRHQSGRKRVSNGVRQHFKSQESRAQAAIVHAEAKRRKLAGKLTREVKGWWNKLEKVITYRQKVIYDKSRQQAMNRQLVTLVKQTERYTESLAHTTTHSSSANVSDSEDENDEEDDNNNTTDSSRRRRRRQGKRRLTIEEALAQTTRTRKVYDYARLAKLQEASASEDDGSVDMYGVTFDSTSDNASDSSFAPESVESDDETTLREAEAEEQKERAGGELGSAFVGDPIELLKLQEEQKMDVDAVIRRLNEETKDNELPVESEDMNISESEETAEEKVPNETAGGEKAAGKRVKFAPKAEVRPMEPDDPGAQADDDGDASDVEDFVEDEDKTADDEFEPEGVTVDDETTMEQEEALPQEMTAEEELKMLNDEMEIPVEELRKRYAAAFAQSGDNRNEPGEGLEQDSDGATKEPDKGDNGDNDDEEFEPEKGADVDDETTMEAEERLGRDMSYTDELALLQREGEMSVEELRAMYAGMEDTAGTDEDVDVMDVDETDPPEQEQKPSSAELFDKVQDGDGDQEEFQPEFGGDLDDETTIEAEERLGRDMSYEDELALLKQEGEVSVEELRAMYSSINEEGEDDEEIADEEDIKPSALTSLVSGADGQHGEMPSRRKYRGGEAKGDGKREVEETEEAGSSARKAKKQRTDPSEATASDTEAALAALEQSAERARTTLASRPFLLSGWVKLREYQQIGLNWLVSLHSRRLNGILADEMGLGKTLQTITLLAYLAAYKGIWGPHLIVVPTSVILNWETELKRFCPSFKVLCYYGSAKRRKELRTGWTKTNVYHVVITSYQLAVQDAFAFKRKRWYYLVLDEAQNIKNFQSQRWQTLISFNTQRRLLLSGTPLQNTLLELWSLLHFLMPYIFRSRKEFSYWFANPMTSMIEGNSDQNTDVVQRLHGILRPFILRRLKKDVETQMPGKFEHIVKCQLSRRQMYLYEEFMARSSTRHALKKTGNFMAMMNVLMQLRKVCNHPDLFEARSIVTPFVLEPVPVNFPRSALLEPPSRDSVSPRLVMALWCGSTGQPAIDSALSHDPVEADGLHRFRRNSTLTGDVEPIKDEVVVKDDDPLQLLLEQIRETRREARWQSTLFHNHLNTLRCDTKCFPYSERLQRVVETPGEFRVRADLNVLDTPADLLALRRTQQQRADDVDQLVKKFVFCVPKAGVKEESSMHDDPHDILVDPVNEYLKPFREVEARLSSFFPDKKLVQFDAGKLQTLAELLRELKRGGHKTLIFTQMSKMLDILEAFLNLNGHTYLRLDGSTGVDRRQRLMDRFNNDPKIFCFILSTRSGGLGINLTGADTVVFYDTDWNPAMDAQAQDRAHRIGQTREVHVYRLVTEQTIEENILMKAKQKKNLDVLVMDRGKFDSSHLFRSADEARMAAPDTSSTDVYSRSGLQSILGLPEKHGEPEKSDERAEGETQEKDMTTEQMESAMTELEDKDDVQALRGAQKEAAEELKEFDETVEIKKEEGDDEEEPQPKGGQDNEKDEKAEREALEKEFAAWQTEVGMDNEAIEASLSPVERYGLHLREEVDPFYSLYAVLEYNRKMDEAEEADNEIDIDEIEAEKAADERRAIMDGDLLVTDPLPEELVRQRNLFQRERARVKANRKRRQMTGENWETRVDQHNNSSFWYNVDTGEARWDKPPVLLELESFNHATSVGWSMLPSLVNVMSFLVPYPERTEAALVCRQWKKAAFDPGFVRHVYPVEMGAATRSTMHHNHFRSLADALNESQPGDAIEFSDGHYWVNGDLVIEHPVRLVGDEYHPSNVIIEMNNGSCIEWKAKGGWVEGISFRRPRITSSKVITQPIIRLQSQSRLHMYACTIDNEGSAHGVALKTLPDARAKLERVSVRAGAIEAADGSVERS